MRAAPKRRSSTITLIPGQVTVRPAAGSQGIAPAVPIQLLAGERVRLVKAAGVPASAAQDRPPIEQMRARKHGEAGFDNVSLADAVAVKSRYSRTPIVLQTHGALSPLRVSGRCRTSDGKRVSYAEAALHGLPVPPLDGR